MNPGVAEGAVGFGPGLVDQAFNFNAASMVRVPNHVSLEPQQFTIDAWVLARSAGSTADGAGAIVVSMDSVRHPGITYDLVGPGTTGLFMTALAFTDGTSVGALSVNAFPFNQWHNLAATWDGTTITLYVNGQFEDNGSLGPKTVYYEGTDVGIGRHPIHGTRAFDGFIDEVEFFDRALEQPEIQAIFDAGPAGQCKDRFFRNSFEATLK